MLATAINNPNPVVFFEHKALYRSIRQDVPTDYYTLPFGKANLLKEGNDATIVAYGATEHWALEILENHEDINADLIDLRTLQPLDTETIYKSVKKYWKDHNSSRGFPFRRYCKRYFFINYGKLF